MRIEAETDRAAACAMWPWIGGALLILTTVLAYWPALAGGFIWDDDLLVTNNRLIQSSNGLSRIWFTTEPIDYWPLTNSSFWLEWRLWGMRAAGYHATNLFLHIVAALLVWALLKRLAIPGAYLGAMLFAVHPVNVESVAWIAQRKNTLAIVFYFLSILWYLRSQEAVQNSKHSNDSAQSQLGKSFPFDRFYFFSLIAFLIAMLSKGSVAILPLVLLIFVWWRNTRLTPLDFARIGPFFMVAALLTCVNIWFQTHGAESAVRHADFFERLADAGTAVWFYLAKALLPIDLMFIYPQWAIHTADVLWWLPLAAAVVLTALLVWKASRNSSRSLLLAWSYFCIGLAPVAGFIDVYFMKYSLVADHYQYLSLVAVTSLVAAGWWEIYCRFGLAAQRAWIAAAAFVVAVLTYLTMQQCAMYRDSASLWQTAIDKNPACWMAYQNLGLVALAESKPQHAVDLYRKTLALKPDHASAYYDIGVALANMGNIGEAIENFRKTIRLKPDYVEAHNNLGAALFNVGKQEEALAEFTRAIELKPNNADAHNNLAAALNAMGRPQEALGHCMEALRLNPDDASVHNNLGNAYVAINQLDQGVEEYRRALAIDPKFAEARANLGVALARNGQVAEAVGQFQKAIELAPNNLQTYANLWTAYANLHRPNDAIATAEQALRIARDHHQNDLTKQIEDWLREFRTSQGLDGGSGPSALEPNPPAGK